MAGATALGWSPLQASAGQMFGPRGLCRLTDGSLWVADTGHHRLLRFAPGAQAADLWLGQADAQGDAPNGAGPVHGASFWMPVGLCRFGDHGLAVADSWNHRVLIWLAAPTQPGQPADLVLGQAGFGGALANRGSDRPSADSLFWPSGLWSDGQRLAVADTGNRRVLIWQALPRCSGQPADQVLGQSDMDCRDENGGTDLDACGMVWPHAVTDWRGDLVVADAGASRMMSWSGWPRDDGSPCQRLLGQADPGGRLHNRGHPRPGPDSLAMPYAVVAWRDWLLVADTMNSRLLGWRPGQDRASWLYAQTDFSQAGDNRWQAPAQDSLCWPYGLSLDGDRLLVADTGNNRILELDLEACVNAG